MDKTYIELDLAEKAMQTLEENDIELYGAKIAEGFDGERAAEALKEIPPADVRVAIHARWIDDGSGKDRCICSNCKEGEADRWHGSGGCSFKIRKMPAHYCPVCGAIMDWKASDQSW